MLVDASCVQRQVLMECFRWATQEEARASDPTKCPKRPTEAPRRVADGGEWPCSEQSRLQWSVLGHLVSVMARLAPTARLQGRPICVEMKRKEMCG